MPVIGFGALAIGGGMGGIDEAAAVRTLHALDQGVTLIDTAEAYRTSEETIGKALASWSGQRERLFVATKVRGSDLSRAHVMAAIERSLRALGLEQVDLLRPTPGTPGTPSKDDARLRRPHPRAGALRGGSQLRRPADGSGLGRTPLPLLAAPLQPARPRSRRGDPPTPPAGDRRPGP